MRQGLAERRRLPEGWPEASGHHSGELDRVLSNQPLPTYTGPTKGILLKASFAVTAVGAREVVAHLALLAVVHARLTLIHICRGR